MSANTWAKTPKAYVILVMVAYLLMVSLWSFNIKGIENGIVAVGFACVLDVLCALVAGRKRLAPDGAVVTGLIIALILSVTSPWYIVAATSVIAILSKHLLVYKKKPIFNPAAFGLLLSVLIFKSEQSWWGAFGDLPGWTVAFLLIGGYLVTNRVNKYPQVFAFLAVYLGILYAMAALHTGDAADALRPPFINATLFFALFMLTDPPTSPAKVKQQIFFGIVSAIVGAAVYGLFGGLMYLFIGLMVGNIYTFLKSRSTAKVPEKQVKMARGRPVKGHQ